MGRWFFYKDLCSSISNVRLFNYPIYCREEMQISFRGLAVGKLFQLFAIIDSNVQKRSILSRNRIFFIKILQNHI